MNTAQVSFTKKEIFRLRYAALFFMQYIFLLAIIFIIRGNNGEKLVNLFLEAFTPVSFMSVEVTVSFLSITIMQLLLPDARKQILGIQFQVIYFKWDILRFFNFINCFLYMFLLMTLYVIMAIGNVCIESGGIQTICKAGALLSLIETFPLAFYMVYLGFTAKYKNSRIYYLIFKRIKSEIFPNSLFQVKNKICNRIGIDLCKCKVSNEVIKSEDCTVGFKIGDRSTCSYNIYIKDQFFIIVFLFLNVKKIKLKNIDENRARAILYGKFKTMIQEEYAYNKAILQQMRLWGAERFGEDIDELFAFCSEKDFPSQIVYPARTCAFRKDTYGDFDME